MFAGEDEVPLTGKEFEVLNVLVANRDKVVSRDRLMADVWDENWYGSTKTLDVTIGRLRQKLESVGVPEKVVAVRGVGFRLEGGPSDCVTRVPCAAAADGVLRRPDPAAVSARRRALVHRARAAPRPESRAPAGSEAVLTSR